MTETETETEGEPGTGWRALAADLETHGVPERRAQIVALRAHTDRTYQEIADHLGLESKGSVGNQIQTYRETRENAQWLATHAPDV